ncbi:hypothetical protein PENSPDRAFT_679054 [Peniophora sp. CONT]|nr:hypothetical protein PENSPDRAFT_679054 [Peniophora sp. CONT]
MTPLPHSPRTQGRLSPRVSFSGPTPSRRAAKRTHSNLTCSPSHDGSSSPSCASDPDPWRLAKRARLARTPSYTKSVAVLGLKTRPKIVTDNKTALGAFATTTAAFGLPSRPMRRMRRARSKVLPTPDSTRMTDRPRVDMGDILDLNAQAFGELRQSITNCGEDFVERMRALEAERLQASAPTICNTASADSPMQIDAENTVADDGDEEEEDVEIFSGESSSDVVLPDTSPHRASTLLGSSSDAPIVEDAVMQPLLPAHTLTRPTRRNSLAAIYNIPEPTSTSKPRRSDEDRAIDALSLAMATGAGGIRDYSAVRDALGFEPPTEAAAEVGGMWD